MPHVPILDIDCGRYRLDRLRAEPGPDPTMPGQHERRHDVL